MNHGTKTQKRSKRDSTAESNKAAILAASNEAIGALLDVVDDKGSSVYDVRGIGVVIRADAEGWSAYASCNIRIQTYAQRTPPTY